MGSAGGYHCEVRVEDSMLMIGGGGPGVAWKGESMLGAFHVYVRDCDAAYQQALEAGGKSLQTPPIRSTESARRAWWMRRAITGTSRRYKETATSRRARRRSSRICIRCGRNRWCNS